MTEKLIADPWTELRAFTQARIALGRTGVSLSTNEVLNLSYAHAQARDAVMMPLDTEALSDRLHLAGFECVIVDSAAPDRATYLLRPDLGRQLSTESCERLRNLEPKGSDFVVVVGDGLSSIAVSRHSILLLERIRNDLPAEWRFGPVVIGRQARVALGDSIGELLGAKIVVVLIGERPGLSSPDSLSVYLTYAPKRGCLDSERNCVSNIRPEGLEYSLAAHKIIWLAREAMRLGLSGVCLKDLSDEGLIDEKSRHAASLPDGIMRERGGVCEESTKSTSSNLTLPR